MKFTLMILCVGVATVHSGRAALTYEKSAPVTIEAPANTRHGFFDWLDHRSDYGQGVFLEPFLVADTDLEPNEARVDWLHTRGDGSKTDRSKVEVEKGFGLMTLELEIPYERDVSAGGISRGLANMDVGARGPFFQFVSRSGLVDATFGAALELGIPTGSDISKHAELVPKLFNDLKIGDFTVQSILGHSTLFGQGEAGGLQVFEYGFVFGYTIPRCRLPLPEVIQVIPFLELKGETELNKGDPGHNSLLGNLGLRFNLKAIGRVQPRPGIGFVFPIDGARAGTHWGVITSFVFQF